MYLHNDFSENKQLFCNLLRGVGRPHTEELLSQLEAYGFFQAPASCKPQGHLPVRGGLVVHSLNTYAVARTMSRLLSHYVAIPHDSIIVSALLHDVCKSNRYVLLSDGTYQRNAHSTLPIGHSEKSLAMIMATGYPLTESEVCAIRWHMAPFRLNQQCPDELSSYECAVRRYPLVTLIGCSDTLCAKIIEVAQGI